MRPDSVTVHIERLVLDGVLVGTHGSEPIGAAVQSGLRRLLLHDATAPHPRSDEPSSTMHAPAVMVPARGDSAQLGDAIARAVHQGMRDACTPQAPDGEGIAP